MKLTNRFWLFAAAMFAFPAIALAQTPGFSNEAAREDISYFDFFVIKGGWITYFLVVLSVVTVALLIRYSRSMRRPAIVPEETVTAVRAMLAEKKYVDAIKQTGEDESMVAQVVHAALIEAPNGYAAMERTLEETLDERSSRLYRKIEHFHVIGNIAPMVGLFGTVTGMILLFAEIHATEAFPGPRIVAERIAVALVTTFWGLAVAIPALSIYGLFRNWIDVLTAECALTAEDLLSVFKPGAAARANAAGGQGAVPPSPDASAGGSQGAAAGTQTGSPAKG